jgi:hypothetical protein
VNKLFYLKVNLGSERIVIITQNITGISKTKIKEKPPSIPNV